MAFGSYAGASVSVDITGGISISPIPSTAIGPLSKFFLNGTAYDMNVDGSVTPQYFDVAPPAGEIWYAENLTIGGDDTGGTPPENFWADTALSNGLKLDLIKDSSTYEIVNLKNNGDVLGTFNFSVGSFEGGGFLNFSKGFAGKQVFATAIALNGDNNDKFRVTVRDDLTGLLFLRMYTQIWNRLA